MRFGIWRSISYRGLLLQQNFEVLEEKRAATAGKGGAVMNTTKCEVCPGIEMGICDRCTLREYLYQRSYALEAERKMGQLLAAGQEAGIVRERGRYPKTNIPEVLEIAELGISWRESSDAQKLAELPKDNILERKQGCPGWR